MEHISVDHFKIVLSHGYGRMHVAYVLQSGYIYTLRSIQDRVARASHGGWAEILFCYCLTF